MSKKLSHYLLSLLALGAASCTSQQEIEDMSETTEERPDVGTLSDDVTTRVDWYDVLRDRWRKDNEKMSFQLHFRRDILLTNAEIALLCPSKSICQQIVTPKICISCRKALPLHRETFANTVLIC